MRKIILIFTAFMLFVGCQTLRSEEIVQEVSEMESKYFEIAQKKIKELGMDAQNMQCHDKTTEWEDFFKKENKKQFSDLSQKLTDKDFIAIYCGPKEFNVMGGDINVFIDRETDEIIDVLRGQ